MVSNIYLRDNNCGKNAILESESQYDDISFFANQTISDLIKDNPYLLIFPHSLMETKDEIGNSEILHLSGARSNLNQCMLTTNNIMGFIGYGNTKVNITSRFCQNEKSKPDYFLHYLLQKVLSINLFKMNYTFSNSSDFGFDLLIYLFPTLLKKALSQGVIKQYRTFKYNDAKVNGGIDIPRHIKLNYPFNGKIAYKTREYTPDNAITQLIRHTIECIQKKENGDYILNNDYDTIKCVNVIKDITQTYSKYERQKIINENLRIYQHPYFTEYQPLQKLCLQILRNEEINYSDSDNEVYGMLFDGAWLWEEFLATFLTNKTLNFIHPQNKLGINGIQVYKGKFNYPDFYRGKQSDQVDLYNNFVLDAKYKRLDINVINNTIRPDFSRDDLHQIITYMHILPASEGALIYPISNKQLTNTVSEKYIIKGLGGKIWTIGFIIPQEYSSFDEFYQQMKNSIEAITNELLIQLQID